MSKEKPFLGFKDDCAQLLNGKYDRGPGVVCWIFLACIGIGLITELFDTLKALSNENVTVKQYSAVILDLFTQVLGLFIIYRMCFLCNPWYGLLILCIMRSLSNVIKVHILLS